ncbi:HD domain-containing protein [Anaeromicrobium sediminis]|uniref:HAD family hydrolase n=1 Tax=Anaeromicrobium sediminis TaxID=1478221 RepID=A0A267MFT1_9FIRM|nr:HD domain-containing protein [Anaeromicrobium sediminis]PAB57735.1 HAD family hydrolase [Anaeromicrobium sediminis]
MEIMRENALSLLKEHVEADSLMKHCLAVEASMRGYAKKFGEDVERWGACGLLHDVDFEKYPDTHPLPGTEILKDSGYDDEFVTAVKGHSNSTNTPRETTLAKTLYSVDELSGFVIACVLVRPNKFEGLKVKSIKKKLKDKAFAKAINRDQIKESADELGVDLTEHIQTVVDAIVLRETELNEMGMSLIG